MAHIWADEGLMVPIARVLPLLCCAGGCAFAGDWPDAGSISDAGPATDARSSSDPDAADAEGSNDDAGAPGPRTVQYPLERRHSPINAELAENLRAIAARRADVDEASFAKVGASATVSTNFLHCFADESRVDLDGRDSLEDTLSFFRGAERRPFDRDSNASVVGWHAGRALEGDPSALDRELEATDPRYAVVMYGTNDLNIVSFEQYGRNMLTLADAIAARGAIPLLTSIMARGDDPMADDDVPLFNLIVRGIAQGRGFPFVDFHRELVSLPDRGLASDGIHPNVFRVDGGAQACRLDESGLAYGYNMRNLLTLEQLDRARRVIVGEEEALDSEVRRLDGEGSRDNPFVVPDLPFTDLRNTSDSEHREIDRYPACGAQQDESGPELYYRFELLLTTTIHAFVVSESGADIDLHLLDTGGTADDCLIRDHRELTATLRPGVYWFVLDSFVSETSGELPGEFLFLLMAEE